MEAHNKIVFAVLTISDTCHTDATKDRSGPRLKQLLTDNFQNCHVITEILPDECELIREKLRILILQRNPHVSAIITTGGTGFAPRDVTPEATKPLIDKECTALSAAITLASLQKTKFAALTRGVCGIAQQTLIMNFPGSEKAVVECFDVVRDLLPHALQLIGNDLPLVKELHTKLQSTGTAPVPHVCPHKTGAGDDNDRNSPFPMIAVEKALDIIFETVKPTHNIEEWMSKFVAPVNIPPFRASIKDGYAMKSTGFSGVKKVIANIAAGDPINQQLLQEDECFKINTGAAIPAHADCVVQIEDTKLLKRKKTGEEDLIEVLLDPQPNLDIRQIGSDLAKGSSLFPAVDHSAVVIKSILASVGEVTALSKPKIAIVSTGSELLAPHQAAVEGKIFDSNTTMLEELLNYFGFECMRKVVLSDSFAEVEKSFADLFESVDFVICSGGVSMGDKDYVKAVLMKLNFDIKFGRVNMKPGKPMTYASNKNKHFFGLPGNPVSAFVTFHLFALPAIRWSNGWQRTKCSLSQITVILENPEIPLDPRPEYMRATVTSKNGSLYANITGNQISSRLQSIVGADVLVHFPARTDAKKHAVKGDVLTASVLRYDFISEYK